MASCVITTFCYHNHLMTFNQQDSAFHSDYHNYDFEPLRPEIIVRTTVGCMFVIVNIICDVLCNLVPFIKF